MYLNFDKVCGSCGADTPNLTNRVSVDLDHIRLLCLLDYDLLLLNMDGAYVPKQRLADRCSGLKPGV